MSDMKCPFCQQELEIWHTNRVRMYACPDLTCKGYYMSATKDMWQELIRTRKALDVAVDALKRLNNDSIFGMRVLGIADQAITAINEITAQEQKDK